jgi:hypothetical protein
VGVGAVRMLKLEGTGEGDEAALRELRFRWSTRSGEVAMSLQERNSGSQLVAGSAQV